MLLGHHGGEVDPRGPVEACRDDAPAGPTDLHLGWDLVHHDWGVRQRESSGHHPCPVLRLLHAARALARRFLHLVLRASVALASVRSHD